MESREAQASAASTAAFLKELESTGVGGTMETLMGVVATDGTGLAAMQVEAQFPNPANMLQTVKTWLVKTVAEAFWWVVDLFSDIFGEKPNTGIPSDGMDTFTNDGARSWVPTRASNVEEMMEKCHVEADKADAQEEEVRKKRNEANANAFNMLNDGGITTAIPALGAVITAWTGKEAVGEIRMHITSLKARLDDTFKNLREVVLEDTFCDQCWPNLAEKSRNGAFERMPHDELAAFDFVAAAEAERDTREGTAAGAAQAEKAMNAIKNAFGGSRFSETGVELSQQHGELTQQKREQNQQHAAARSRLFMQHHSQMRAEAAAEAEAMAMEWKAIKTRHSHALAVSRAAIDARQRTLHERANAKSPDEAREEPLFLDVGVEAEATAELWNGCHTCTGWEFFDSGCIDRYWTCFHKAEAKRWDANLDALDTHLFDPMDNWAEGLMDRFDPDLKFANCGGPLGCLKKMETTMYAMNQVRKQLSVAIHDLKTYEMGLKALLDEAAEKLILVKDIGVEPLKLELFPCNRGFGVIKVDLEKSGEVFPIRIRIPLKVITPMDVVKEVLLTAADILGLPGNVIDQAASALGRDGI